MTLQEGSLMDFSIAHCAASQVHNAGHNAWTGGGKRAEMLVVWKCLGRVKPGHRASAMGGEYAE